MKKSIKNNNNNNVKIVDTDYLEKHYTFYEIITLMYQRDGISCPEFEEHVAIVELH